MKSLNVRTVLDLLAYSDGTNSLEDIADKINRSTVEVRSIVERLIDEGLLEEG